MIEERPGDGFQNRGLARAVRAADGDDSGLEREVGLGVILDVPEFDFGDQQGGKSVIGGQWSVVSGQRRESRSQLTTDH
jgi:hypothetical protein